MCLPQLNVVLSKLSSAMTDWRIGVLADTQGGGGRRWRQMKNKLFSQFSGYTQLILCTLFISLTV